MVAKEYQLHSLAEALDRGGASDLRFACEMADRIVDAAFSKGHQWELSQGFSAFRARSDYVEDDTSYPGQTKLYPLLDQDMCAPPSNKTSLGRFNPPKLPMLYLSTTEAVVLAEVRATSSDYCSVGKFETMRSMSVAHLLQHQAFPLNVLFDEEPEPSDLEQYLLAGAADFVSRPVQVHNREVHYRSCNLIASAFMERGYDGLAYRTAFWSPAWDEEEGQGENWKKSLNLVLFDPECANIVDSWVSQIDWPRPLSKRV